MKSLTSVKLKPALVQSAREAAKHTQSSLALALGVSTRQIKRIEKTGNTSNITAKAMCKSLDVNLEHLQGKNGLEDYLLYFPYYWSTSYPKNVDSLSSEQKLGQIFLGTNDVFQNIADVIDGFYQNIDNPCTLTVRAELTVDKVKNCHFVDVHSYSTSGDSNFESYRFEIRPFKFSDSGMKWHECSEPVNRFFEQAIELFLNQHVTEYITYELPEVKDSYYSVQLIQKQIETLKLSVKQFDAMSKDPEYAHLFNNMKLDQYQIDDFVEVSIGVFLFDKLEGVENFLHDIIQNHQFIEVNTNREQIYLKASPIYSEMDLIVEITKVSQSQNRKLPWPLQHQHYFFNSLCKFTECLTTNSNNKYENINSDNLRMIANKYNALELKNPITSRTRVPIFTMSDIFN